ncbi:ABC transporter ATP-binding protein [Janibacter alittae]|uniref:ABC transporter ATP-binding protein n=1 Tax=Janibacter alittae TaxID=3115209 RepID=A0ABZ2MEL8_9MICO
MTLALRLSAITHRHPGTTGATLSDVGLDVRAGQMVAVLGPSGSGKTTLLRVAAGLESPESGEVLLDGVDVSDVPPERRDLTMMFQKPHLFPHLNVVDNVAFADRLRSRDRASSRVAAQRYLDLVHLGDLGRRRPRQLSGGQEQRVSLARALAAQRRVMLLDEPFSSLDTGLRTSMHRLLDEVRATLEPTIVMVTHDLAEAELADRVAVLVEGRIQQFDVLGALYTAPRTLAVARLVGGFNEVAGRVDGGVHHSSLGSFFLPGEVESTGASILVVRKERLELAPLGSPGSLTGLVVQVRQSGAHQDVVVALEQHGVAAGPRVTIEARLGSDRRPGDRTGVRMPGADGLWAVPDPARTGSGTPPPEPRLRDRASLGSA